MKKIKSIKIFKVQDTTGSVTELFWINGQLIDNTTKAYLTTICGNSVPGMKNFKAYIAYSKSKIYFRELVKEYTKSNKIKLKNFLNSDCNCELCLNELPLIIKEKKNEFPTAAGQWTDYIRLAMFCVIKQQKHRIDRKEPIIDDSSDNSDSSSNEEQDGDTVMGDEDNEEEKDKEYKFKKDKENEEDEDEEEANSNGNNTNSTNNNKNTSSSNIKKMEDEQTSIHLKNYGNGLDYYIKAKDLYEYIYAHRGLMEIDKSFKKYQPKTIKTIFHQTLGNNPDLFKSGKDIFGIGHWTLQDPDDDPWFDIDVPDDIATEKVINGVVHKVCLAQTKNGFCQRIGICPSHQKWEKGMKKDEIDKTNFAYGEDYDNQGNDINNEYFSDTDINNAIDESKMGYKCKNFDHLKIEKNIMNKFSFTSIIERIKVKYGYSSGKGGGITDDVLQELPREYTRFMILKFIDMDHVASNDSSTISLQPSELINSFWQLHIIHTQKYNEFSKLLKTKVYHNPSQSTEPIEHQRKRYQRTLKLYKRYFTTTGDNQPDYYFNDKIWPTDIFLSNNYNNKDDKSSN